MQHVSSENLAKMAPGYTEVPFMCVTKDVTLGERVLLRPFCNLYGCTIGNDTKIGAFVEVQRDVVIGARVKIQDFVSICTGVTIGDDVFIGPGVIFTNDKRPDPFAKEWSMTETRVEAGAVIGAGAIIHPGAHIGAGAFVAAGAVVTVPVPAGHFVAPPRCEVIKRLPPPAAVVIHEKAWHDEKALLLAFLAKQFIIPIDTIDHDLTYFQQGILDSTGILELVQYIEEHLSIKIADEEITEENLGGVNKTVTFIRKKQKEKAA